MKLFTSQHYQVKNSKVFSLFNLLIIVKVK